MKHELSKTVIEAIEKVLNIKSGSPEVTVKIEKGEIVVLQVDKKKIL